LFYPVSYLLIDAVTGNDKIWKQFIDCGLFSYSLLIKRHENPTESIKFMKVILAPQQISVIIHHGKW